MGMFAAIGVSKALSLGVGDVGSLVVGVLAAIGGGVLRDVILDRPIAVLHVGTLYAVAACAGSAVLIVLTKFDVPVSGRGKPVCGRHGDRATGRRPLQLDVS